MLGGVSVRMLRHYHEIGLLEPSFIDDVTGYRHYETSQTQVLRRIVRLKSLGLTLTQVSEVVNGRLTTEEVRELLLDRRDQVVEEVAAGRATLEAIDREVDLLFDPSAHMEEEDLMSEIDVEIKPVAPRLVAQISGVAKSWHPTDIGPVIQSLYPDLFTRLSKTGVEVSGQTMAWYDDSDDGQVNVHATVQLDEATADRLRSHMSSESSEIEIVQLPAVEQAAVTNHHGSMDNCYVTYEALISWIGANGYQTVGQYSREVDLECGPNGPVLTEIQMPIEAV